MQVNITNRLLYIGRRKAACIGRSDKKSHFLHHQMSTVPKSPWQAHVPFCFPALDTAITVFPAQWQTSSWKHLQIQQGKNTGINEGTRHLTLPSLLTVPSSLFPKVTVQDKHLSNTNNQYATPDHAAKAAWQGRPALNTRASPLTWGKGYYWAGSSNGATLASTSFSSSSERWWLFPLH